MILLQEIEATLHCVMSIQEAIPLDENPHLSRLFSSEILERFPTAGQDRIRRTVLGTIGTCPHFFCLYISTYGASLGYFSPSGTYASWFTTQPASSSLLLMNAISYVVAALSEPTFCLEAANALRDLCDANRTALAPHMGAFAEIHAGLAGIPVDLTLFLLFRW